MSYDRSISESAFSDTFLDTTLGLTFSETPTPTPSFGSISSGPLKTRSEVLFKRCNSSTCPTTPFPTPRSAESIRSLPTPRPLPGYLFKQDSTSPFTRPSTPAPGYERIISPYELMKYTGLDSQPIWLGINNIVFDVSSSREFYGPGKVFNIFTGKDTLANANVNLFDLSHDLASQLTFESSELSAEQNRKLTTTCLDIYAKKYPVVGRTKQN